MKKWLFVCGLIANSFCSFAQENNVVNEYKYSENQLLDSINVRLVSGELFTLSQLKSKPFLMVLFNPTCGHCQELAQAIKLSDFFEKADNQVVFVAPENMETYTQQFYKAVGLNTLSNVFMGTASEEFIQSWYQDGGGIPQVLLFNSKKKFLKRFTKDAVNIQMIEKELKKTK